MSYRHKRTGVVIDKRKFQSLYSWETHDYEHIHERDTVDRIIDIGIGMAIGDMLFGDSGSSSTDIPDTSSFGEFGGGDFGGGGAGGEW